MGLRTCLSQALDSNNINTPTCPFLGPRQHIQEWKALGADNVLLQGIQKGVQAPLHQVPTPKKPRASTLEHYQETMTTIGECLNNGVIRHLTPEEEARTKYWVPAFPRLKKDSHKIRLITDLRALNSCHQIPKDKAETWKHIMGTLQDTSLKWGLTLDLKNFFHHLQIHPRLQRWMRMQVHHRAYQLVGMPFGWAMSPWWSNKMTKPIRAWLNSQQWSHCWYVDDILILGQTKQQAEERAYQLIQLLTTLGIRVNKEKSMLQAAQTFQYLGHQFNLQQNTITPIPSKLQTSIQMLKHQLKSNVFQPRNVAAVAGNLLDATKSNPALLGLPQQLMKEAARGVQANQHKLGLWDRHRCWQMSTQKSPKLQELLQQCLTHTLHPVPRVLRPTKNDVFILTTDASNLGWGAQLVLNHKEVQTCAQKWEAAEATMHITHREALASAKALEQILPHLPPGIHLNIQTDATSTAWAWNKGSKVFNINNPIVHMYRLAAQQGIYITAQHIPGTENKRADWLSRNPDPKSYTLDRTVFHKVCQHFHFHPNIDLFANRHNRQVKTFCSWRADRLSQGNAFNIPWSQHKCWLNPPWELIPRCLHKLTMDKAQALVCLPMWQSAPWWRDLLKLLKFPPLVVKNHALERNPEGEWLPPPRWATLFGVVQA